MLLVVYNILKYTMIPSFTKRLKVVGVATLKKNPRPPIPKWSDESCLQKNEGSQTKYILSTTCQIDVVNKQLAPPLS